MEYDHGRLQRQRLPFDWPHRKSESLDGPGPRAGRDDDGPSPVNKLTDLHTCHAAALAQDPRHGLTRAELHTTARSGKRKRGT
jgi:hypothetical protein